MSNTERTFIMVKPDGVQRHMVHNVMEQFEKRGYKLVAAKFMMASKSLLEQHYADLSAKVFFSGLVEFMSSGPVMAMVWEGKNVVKNGRRMLGETNPADSAKGTLRGDYAIDIGRNIVHGSDSVVSANKEIALWFKPEELVNWSDHSAKYIYE